MTAVGPNGATWSTCRLSVKRPTPAVAGQLRPATAPSHAPFRTAPIPAGPPTPPCSPCRLSSFCNTQSASPIQPPHPPAWTGVRVRGRSRGTTSGANIGCRARCLCAQNGYTGTEMTPVLSFDTVFCCYPCVVYIHAKKQGRSGALRSPRYLRQKFKRGTACVGKN
jgi:hypothetical protein